MSVVFADTVGFLAIWNRADQWHHAALRAYAEIHGEGASLVTTSFVLLEAGNAAARTGIRREVDDLRIQMQAAGTQSGPRMTTGRPRGKPTAVAKQIRPASWITFPLS